MTTIAQRIESIQASLPQSVKLVAVSKFHPVEALQDAYAAGQRIFGESRVQELQVKQELLPKDVEWHFIGHLQTNKVKYIVPYISMIQSVDSIHILQEINKQAQRVGRVIDCLLEVHVAQEETKYGFSVSECVALLSPSLLSEYPFVRIRGIMGMATYTDDQEQIALEFSCLKNLFDTLCKGSMEGITYFDTLSMGMSHDYQLAIKYGSTMVRIGTTIFGERVY